MKRRILDALLEAKAGRLPVAVVTDIATGAQSLVGPTGAGDLDLTDAEMQAVAEAVREDRSGLLESEGLRPLFVDVHNPAPRLVVVGAVHISQHLIPMARQIGYEVTVIDPREAFATAERFPDVSLTHDWPDEALEAMVPDSRTALVTLTHDPKLDDPALEIALRSPVFYIGSLGSRKTHAKRVERLRERGFSEKELERIHAPVGLAIGARSPAEIAVSILAEITAVRRGA